MFVALVIVPLVIDHAYVVAPAGELKESWPIGRLPDRPPLKVLPELFAMVNVEIESQPLGDVLESIRSRLKAPW